MTETIKRSKRIFTTGRAAKLCGVASRTMCKWIDAGLVPAYRLPSVNGTPGDRRVLVDGLVAFMKSRHMPLGDLADIIETRVLLIGASASLYQSLTAVMPEAADFHLVAVGTSIEAGTSLCDFRPHAIVIDLAIGRAEAMVIAAHVRKVHADGGCPLVMAIAGEDEADPTALHERGFEVVFKAPIDPQQVADRIAVATANA